MIKEGDIAWCNYSSANRNNGSIPYEIVIAGCHDAGYTANYPGIPIEYGMSALRFFVPLDSVFEKESDAWKGSYESLSEQMNHILAELEEIERGIKGALLRELSM